MAARQQFSECMTLFDGLVLEVVAVLECLAELLPSCCAL